MITWKRILKKHFNLLDRTLFRSFFDTMNPFDKNARHEKIYNKISSLFGIKFKAQIENSPIEFCNLFFVEDLIGENKNYVLYFKDQAASISFQDKVEFIKNFTDYLNARIQEFEKNFDELNKFEHNSMGIKYDENEIYMRHEHIGDSIYKLDKLKERLTKL